MDRPILDNDIFLSYYGDDFTGSSDVMESLALNGIPTALFLEPPTKEEVARFRLKAGVGAKAGSDQLKAFGVAGVARSLTPAAMDQQLPDILERISQIPTDFFQYKICSTFDSSPEIGNIGHATEIALRYFPSDYIPLLVGAPFLNRFVIFGNLFARVKETTYRLDRHPTMSSHPVTPMHESDLRQHLQQQTKRTIRLLDHFRLNEEYGPLEDYFKKTDDGAAPFLLFDTLSVAHLYTIGKLLIRHRPQRTQLIVGASSADYALAFQLQQSGAIEKSARIPFPGKAEKMVVVAGSCAPTTAGQIEYLESMGHEGIRMDSLKLIRPTERAREMEVALRKAGAAIDRGIVPILYTAKGPNDPVVTETRHQLRQAGMTEGRSSELLAGAQGALARDLIAKVGKMRVVVAGGDTSGYVSRALGIYAFETLCPIAPGAPLCVAHSKDPRFDGLEISLKGGQNGAEDYFASVLAGM